MDEFIKIPSYIKDLSQIESRSLKQLCSDEKIEQHKIGLDRLRELYKQDRLLFNVIRDELALRYFKVVTSKPSSLFDVSEWSTDQFIIQLKRGEQFKQINFKALGLPQFLNYFQVEDDTFFHGIPLEGFKKVNPSLNLLHLTIELKRHQFSIGSLLDIEQASVEVFEKEETEPIVEVVTQSIMVTQPESLNFTESEVEMKNTLKLVVDHEELNGKIHSLKTPTSFTIDGQYLDLEIEKVFSENGFNSFRKFCQENRINVIGHLKSYHLINYFFYKGVGIGKFDAVIYRLLHLDEQEIESQVTKEKEILYIGFDLLETVFADYSYKSFLDFCQLHKKTIISDLTYDFLLEYSNQKGVGKKKFDRIRKILEFYDARVYQEKIGRTFEINERFGELKSFSVHQVLQWFNKDHAQIADLTLSQMQGRTFETLDAQIPYEMCLDLMNCLNRLKSPAEIILDLKEILTDREWEIFYLKSGQKETLQSIGDRLGLTRERIRQLLLKTERKVRAFLTEQRFITSLKIWMHGGSKITSTKLLELIGPDYAFIVEFLKEQDQLMQYVSEFDVFFFNQNTYDQEIIQEILDELPDLFNYYEYETYFDEALQKAGLPDIGKKVVGDLLGNKGYYTYGEVFSKKKLSILNVAEYLFEHHIKKPLKIDEEGFEIFLNYAKIFLDYDYSGTPRSLDSRLRDSDHIILVDSLTYIWFNGEFDEDLIQQIDQYIEIVLEKLGVVNAVDLYETFKDQVEPRGITNKLHLYSIVRYFLAAKYKIGSGNTLNIFKDNETKLNIEGILIDYLQKNGGIASKEDICATLGWEPYRVDQRVGASSQIMFWNEGIVRLATSLKITNDQKEQIKILILQLMTQGFTTSTLILNELRFNPELAPLIVIESLDQNNNMSSLAKHLIPTLKGHSIFLYLEDSPYQSVEDVVISMFKGVVTRKELKDALGELGYITDQMYTNTLKNLLRKKSFVEIDLDELCNANHFNIDTDVILEVVRYIEEEMKESEYLAISQLKGYRRRLSRIDFRWTPQLIKSILVTQGYRPIQKLFNDYRYDQIIVVRESSSIQTFEDLVFYLLQNEYEGNWHEREIYSFLEQKGLVRVQNYVQDKVLPYEIRMSEKIKVNSLGIVTLIK